MLINKSKKTQSGFSLVELLAVVGIGGALIAGALLLVNDVNAKKEIKQNSENISAIYSNMNNLFSDEEVITDAQALITSGVFPSTLKIVGTTIKNSSGGEVSIESNGSSKDGYILNYEKVKAAACVEILKNQKRVGWDDYQVDDNTATDLSSASVTDFAGHCQTTDDYVDMVFKVD